MAEQKYKIVRRFLNPFKKRNYYHRTINTGLTLEQAQAHCQDPETSSETCQKAANKARTRQHGPWFDTYEKE